MAQRRLALVVPIALSVAVAVGARTESKAATGNLATTRICTGCADQARDLGRYGYVTLHAWDARRIPRIRAENPHAKILVYKDMASTADYDCHAGVDDPLLPSGMGYCWTLRNHPDWFTTDPRGHRLEWTTWPGNWQMDVGSPGYQDQWAGNVLGELKAKGWDGVVIDDANVDERPQLGGQAMSEYPTQPSYQAATRSFLANVGPKLMKAGFLVIPNIQADPVLANASLWADWTRFTSGGTREYWMKWGSGADGQYGEGGWADLMKVMETVEREGKIFLTTTSAPASDVRSMRWGRASFLIGWNGGPSAFSFDPNAPVDPWSAAWTTDVGVPAGPKRALGGGAYRRDYTLGTAIVNTSGQAARTLDLGRSYLTPEGTPVTQVTLQPLTGLVLRLPQGVVDRPQTAPRKATPARSSTTRTTNRGHMVARRIALHGGRIVHGRVQSAHRGWRVVVYWRDRTARWRLFARTYTNQAGRFRVHKVFRAHRAIPMRAVARAGRARAHSTVVRLSPS
ncbi:MAG TPA: putative glycoside hydrolase [Gaiellaceae bacterium]|nr:putative glycoside hydrolase [Gaiellaceae bacterium]